MFKYIDIDDEDTNEEVKTRLSRKKKKNFKSAFTQISSIKNLPMEPY